MGDSESAQNDIKWDNDINADLVPRYNQLIVDFQQRQDDQVTAIERTISSNELYKLQYMSNWNIFLAIALICFLLFFFFRKPVQDMFPAVVTKAVQLGQQTKELIRPLYNEVTFANKTTK
jgi:hypothetical protein